MKRWTLSSLLLFNLLLPALPALAAEGAEGLPASAAVSPPDPLYPRVSAVDLFGGRLGYAHPFVSLGGLYTDNLFDTSDNEQSDWIGVLSPGLWLSLPERRRPPMTATPLNSAPGGLELSRFPLEDDRRLQAFALYRADIRRHRDFSDEDRTAHRGEGLLSYRLRGGLTLEALDIYESAYEAYGTGIVGRREKFTSNFLQGTARLELAERLLLEFAGSLFNLDYDLDSFRDRDDWSLSSLLGYRVLPRTTVLLNYRRVEIDYDRGILPDSQEDQILGGLQWQASEKLRGRVLLGASWRDIGRAGLDERRDFIGEAQIDHSFTPKTAVFLRATRRTNETDVAGATDILGHRLQVGYLQRPTAKLSLAFDLQYRRDRYRGGTASPARRDDYYGGGLTLGYALQPWLMLGGGYTYIDRDSNRSGFDYRSNNFLLNLTATI